MWMVSLLNPSLNSVLLGIPLMWTSSRHSLSAAPQSSYLRTNGTRDAVVVRLNSDVGLSCL